MLSDCQNELSLELIYIIYSKFFNFFGWKLKLLFCSIVLVSVYTGCIKWVTCGCLWGFPGGSSGKEPTCQYRRHKRRGFDPWVRKTPGEGNGHLLQWTSRGAWQATVHRAAQSRTRLKWLSTHTWMHTRLDMYTLDMYIRSASIPSIFWKSSCEISVISPLNVERNSLVKPSRPWVFYVEKILTRNSISLMDLGSLLLICVFFFFFLVNWLKHGAQDAPEWMHRNAGPA